MVSEIFLVLGGWFEDGGGEGERWRGGEGGVLRGVPVVMVERLFVSVWEVSIDGFWSRWRDLFGFERGRV